MKDADYQAWKDDRPRVAQVKLDELNRQLEQARADLEYWEAHVHCQKLIVDSYAAKIAKRLGKA